MALEAQQSAELLRPFRQTVLLNPYQSGGVVCHHRHTHVEFSPMMALIGDLPNTATKQMLNKALDHRSAIATGTGYLDLMGRALAVQTRLIEHLKHLLLAWTGVDWANRAWHTHCKHPLRVQILAQRLIMKRQITCQGVPSHLEATRESADHLLGPFNQRPHIAAITWVTDGQMPGKDKPRHQVSTHPGLFTTLRRTVALAFDHGRNRRVVSIDPCAMQKLLAVDQPSRLLDDTLMVLCGLLELALQAFALARTQIGVLLQKLTGLLGQGYHRLTHVTKVSLRLPHQLHKHPALPTALAAKAPHHLAEGSWQGSGLCPQRGCALGALLGDLLDDLEDFFFAL